MDAKTYQVNQSTLRLRVGDICSSRADVLVSSDDYMLSMGGGVSYALRSAGGSSIETEARKMVPAKAGDVDVTTAGKLHARYIFHAIAIGEWNQQISKEIIVRQATQRALHL